MKDKPFSFWAMIIAAVMLVGLFGVNLIQVYNKPDNLTQVKQAIEQARKNSIDSKPGGVLDVLSDTFEPPAEATTLGGNVKSVVSAFVKNAKISLLEISVENAEITQANALARCKLQASLQYMGRGFDYTGPMEVTLRQESRNRLLIIPETRWVIVSIQLTDLSQLNMN